MFRFEVKVACPAQYSDINVITKEYCISELMQNISPLYIEFCFKENYRFKEREIQKEDFYLNDGSVSKNPIFSRMKRVFETSS